MIDTIVKVAYDSTANHDAIVSTVNTVLTAVPPVNPTVDYVIGGLITFGSLITGKCIHFFWKRNKDKVK
jgi:hypothetical protein